MPTCPHCGEKIEQEKQVHWEDASAYAEYWPACGNNVRYRSLYVTTDRSRVTCLSCIRTKAYKESE